MERIATDIYTFAELRGGGFSYVDKTDALYAMASGESGKQFFIARPRRFGKSLAVTTFKALFEGRRELFQGLAIEPKWDWSKKWPVLHLDMGTMQYDTVEALENALKSYFRTQATEWGLSVNENDSIPNIFRNMISAAAATSPDGRCVVLIDEYDKPLLKALNTPEVLKFRDFFKPFYGVVKYEESKQRFTFITGVSKFSKVSIFSDLNNLNDWTMNARAATLFGDVIRLHARGGAKVLPGTHPRARGGERHDGRRGVRGDRQMVRWVSIRGERAARNQSSIAGAVFPAIQVLGLLVCDGSSDVPR